MTILATRAIAPHQPLYGQLTCGRCGIEHAGNPRSLQADYCPDCRSEARALGWITVTREKVSA
ncbi:MAG TPA: hypothetical protein DCY59_11260 [Micrococcaceae bacterium]|nr:hypothetical protein [Micrococcaceae bacterium]